jgi:hypothetical protein
VSPRLEVELEHKRYAPGDTVRGTVIVAEGGRSRSLDASLQYKEETSDYEEIAISIPGGRLNEGDLAAGMSFEFELVLPDEALPNCHSPHGKLYWEVDVKSDEPGRDAHARHRIDVRLPARG